MLSITDQQPYEEESVHKRMIPKSELKISPSSKTTTRCKARVVPFAIQDDLCQAYNAGIAKGLWQPTQFNDYGTPVVSIRKPCLPEQPAKLRVCGDYAVTVNQQLEPHRHPMPLPEDLMQKLGGGLGFTQIDLVDAYNQIMLAPESQRRLALSTRQGVLLQTRLLSASVQLRDTSKKSWTS
ncbi:hypothetical protein EMCRGX_G025861 [Ephydatia muelleri]